MIGGVMDLIFKDKAGHKLRPGDLIVYGHMTGDSGGLQYGKVLSVTESKPTWNGTKTIKLRVVGVGGWEGELLRPSVLMYSDRILRILPSQMPDKIFKLLNDYEDKK